MNYVNFRDWLVEAFGDDMQIDDETWEELMLEDSSIDYSSIGNGINQSEIEIDITINNRMDLPENEGSGSSE